MPPDTARVVIHVDVDCFYAQVEELRNPTLRGKPLAVTQKYLCVTTNYAARAKGVAKMMGLKEALAVCPELQLVSGEDLTPYRAASKQILGILAEFGTVERLGMDEAVVDATSAVFDRARRGWSTTAGPLWYGHVFRGSGEQLQAESHRRPMDLRDTSTGTSLHKCDSSATLARDEAEKTLACGSAIAQELRRAVRERVGYACCCGIAHNKLLAKIACGLHKPDNQTSLPAAHASAVMAPLPVRVVTGVGYKTEKVLAELGVCTIAELRSVVASGGGSGGGQLAGAVGSKLATVLAEACWGRDASPVTPRGPPKSITVEDSFKRCGSVAEMKLVLQRLAPDLIERIREEAEEGSRLPSTLTIAWRKGPEFLPGGGKKKRTKSARTSRSVNLPPLPHPFHPIASHSRSVDTMDAAAAGFVNAALAVLRAELGATSYNLTLINLGVTNFKPWAARRSATSGLASASMLTSPTRLSHPVVSGVDARNVGMSKADARLHMEAKQRHTPPTGDNVPGTRGGDDARTLFGDDEWNNYGVLQQDEGQSEGEDSSLDGDDSFWNSVQDCEEEPTPAGSTQQNLRVQAQQHHQQALAVAPRQTHGDQESETLAPGAVPGISVTLHRHAFAEAKIERKKAATALISQPPRQRQKTLDAFWTRC